MKSKTLISLAAFLVLMGIVVGPIYQPDAYHDFADQRTVLGVRNGWNVFSNVLFAIAGIWGLFQRVNIIWTVFSIGLILTAIGSSYYHLSPENATLVWDRLPMTITFMSYVAALIAERISKRAGFLMWPLLVAFGLFSVVYWQQTGDLRFYIGVQLFTILATIVFLRWDIGIAILLFGLARVFEIYDHEIWALTNEIVSGHTLKHLAAGMAGIILIHMLWKRHEN